MATTKKEEIALERCATFRHAFLVPRLRHNADAHATVQDSLVCNDPYIMLSQSDRSAVVSVANEGKSAVRVEAGETVFVARCCVNDRRVGRMAQHFRMDLYGGGGVISDRQIELRKSELEARKARAEADKAMSDSQRIAAEYEDFINDLQTKEDRGNNGGQQEDNADHSLF